MIEKIYGKRYLLICDNCGEGAEKANWQEVLEFLREEEWQKIRVDQEWHHYCKDCKCAY
ncbi:hypothetical protein [Thermotalea metallivorans]|uniref:Uncharacterized protein n=1 Tax=Thermotalea metallivorans TaxID=520762 RepID=A0A140LCI3_9FIRM|nr:hypothetical protein [Thermotalea metallivorans]KXG78258.1 hypothetical protein AN619_02330 [Thermotalea metallivorans]